MKNKKRNWSSTSLLDSSAYTRFSKENFGPNNFKQDFFPNNEILDEKNEKFIINPESAWKLIWDCIMFCILLYQAITTPYYIAFSIDIDIGPIYYSDLCFTCLFSLDILFCFNSAFFHNGDLIDNRKEIIKNYLKSWFWVDIISTFPYDIVYNDISIQSHLNSVPKLLRIVKFYRLLKLLRLAKLKKLFLSLEDYINSEAITNTLLVFKMMILAFIIAHWTACLWYYISLQESFTHPQTWLTIAYFETGSNAEIYVTSLYWAFTTMATIGYGDIVPITVNETIFAIIALLVTCGMFAYVVGSIGILVSKYTEDERIYREKFVEINSYMKNKKIPLDLQFRTRRYLEYIWDKLKIKNISEKDILQLLSEPLKEEVFIYTRGTIISHCKVFIKFSSFFIQQLGKILESHTFAPADIIFEEGEKTFKMYFIRNGEIELFQQSTGTVLKLLKNGKYCGEIALFCNTPRCCSARSVDFLEALVLDKKNFEFLLERNPDAMKIYEILKTKCEQGDLKALEIRCYLCAEHGHVAKTCKKFHLKLNDEKMKKKWIKSRNSASKLINPHDSTEQVHPKKRQFDLKSYNIFNVIGAENHNKELFKDRDDIIEKVNKFYEENDTIKSPKASVSSENNVLINSMRKNTSAESQISNA